MILWLSTIYQEAQTNRLKPGTLEDFYQRFRQILGWIGKTPEKPPTDTEIRLWLEYLSDAIHCLRTSSGILLRDPDLLPRVTREDLVPQVRFSKKIDYQVALDGLRSVFNIGSIFRSCDAAGASGLILGNTPGGEHPQVRKTSMGTWEWMPYKKTHDLAGELLTLKQPGLPVIALETAANARSYAGFAWPEKGIIVFGNEEYGISSHVMRVCDHCVQIPMAGRKNSINVASAVSIILFHISSTLQSRF